MSYKGYIVKLEKIRPHSNADRLNVAQLFNQNVIIGKDLQVGDIVAYFPSDGQLNREFSEYCNLLRKKDEYGNNVGGYMDADKRNVKAIKLRGEYSDGIIVPINKVLSFLNCSLEDIYNGNTLPFDTLQGVQLCNKYVPKTKVSTNRGQSKQVKVIDFPLFHEHKDTRQLAYNLHEFKDGDKVTVSLKLHGTSARTSLSKRTEKNIFKKLWNVIKGKDTYEYVSGSRRVVLSNKNDNGYYGDNSFRYKWNDFFNGRLHKGETVYYEIVGYVSQDKPIMPSSSNKNMDKEFIKTYGDTTNFTYGCVDGENDIYVYRMTMTNEDGVEVDYSTDYTLLRCEEMGVKHVPILDSKVLDLDRLSINDYFNEWDKLSYGTDPIGLTHLREGVIVRIENRKEFTAFKQKSVDFKILEGIIKENAVEPDLEEQSE